jgi:2-polyprenyl-3-methyl-5-hydroxy-6-metoxy-1,4-benzoquinol methylase
VIARGVQRPVLWVLRRAGFDVGQTASVDGIVVFGYQLHRRDRPRPDFEAQVGGVHLAIDRAELEQLWSDYRRHPLNRDSGRIWNQEAAFRETILDVDLTDVRADNAYVYQNRHSGAVKYLVSAQWVQSADRHGLLAVLDEDGAFGAVCIRLGGRLWSRDLMDSALEIGFLLDNLPTGHLDDATVLDIGAGYGRLAHRLVTAVDGVRVLCADGVAHSTVLSRAYTEHRGLGERVRVLTLDEVDHLDEHIDLVTNIHSFSEMPLSAVRWWLDRVAEHQVEYLFVVPNRLGPALNDGTDMMSLLDERGYDLAVQRPKYDDPLVAKHALAPAHYYLFQRRTSTPGHR